MNLKLQKPLIVFDLETTGVDPQKDRIVELAAIKIYPDGKKEEKCRRFNPGISIPPDATKVHGITNDDIKDAPSFSKVARGERGVAAFFRNCDLAGFNIINFDIPLLLAELERAQEKLDISHIAVIDVFKIFCQNEPRTLEGAVKFYLKKTHETAHTALGDVLATFEVLSAQLEQYSHLPDTPLEIDLATRNPDEIDRKGKLKWLNGEVTLNFGRYKNFSLRKLSIEDPDYIRWMLDNNIIDDNTHHLHDALVGHFEKNKSFEKN